MILNFEGNQLIFVKLTTIKCDEKIFKKTPTYKFLKKSKINFSQNSTYTLYMRTDF